MRAISSASKSFFRMHFISLLLLSQQMRQNHKSSIDSFNEGMPEEEQVEVRQKKYLNNIVEQDHRFIKKRTRPILGFKNFYSAKETLSGIENIRMIQKGQIVGQQACQSSFNNFAALMA